MKLSTYFKGGAILLICIALLVLLTSISGWITIILLLLCGFILLYSLVAQLKHAITKPAHRLYAKDFSLKFMATLMGFFLVLGMLLYSYVFYTIGHDAVLTKELGHRVQFSNAEYLLRSLICSLDLFVLDVDGNLLDRLDSHAVLKGWLSIQAVLSFACTVAILVSLVYSRLYAYYRLNYAAKINDKQNHLYLFFGNNEPSQLLIKDIVKGQNDPKAVVIIIDEANVNEDNNNEWKDIIGLITHKRKVFKAAEEIGAHVAIASQQLNEINNDIAAREDFDAFGYLGLSKIKKFISRLAQTSNPQLHIFFMGEDEELNIRNIIVLAKDTAIISAVKNKDLYHCIYCHARYNDPNRVIQDVALKKLLNLQIVDSSHIAVELLKFNPQFHPVNVVKVSEKRLATVETPLKSLIVGFGQVGRDAFRFLYEFGAFVDSKNPDARAPFECVIVDKKLDDIKGAFMASMPGIFKYDKTRHEFECDSVVFENVDYNSQEFYASILLKDKFLKEVNYIVIAIGNNDEAIALAARIFNQIRRVRKDVSNLRIFVHCTDNNKVESIPQKIADHYNCGYGDGEENTPVIQLFGQPEKIYTYDLVISNRLVKEGKLFHEKYRVFSAEGESWEDRHKRLAETDSPNIDKLRKLRRQESQDKANALHAGTKMILLEKAMKMLANKSDSDLDWNSFYLNYFNADGSTHASGSQTQIHYPGLSKQENEIVLHLAKLEHLRWNAAHELMGYVFNRATNGCNERTMEHNCLCEWSKLDSQSDKTNRENREKGNDWVCDYKKYDFCVVDTSIALNKDNLLCPKSDD